MQTISNSIIRQISGGTTLNLKAGYYLARPLIAIRGVDQSSPIVVLVARAGNDFDVLVPGQGEPYAPDDFADYDRISFRPAGYRPRVKPAAVVAVSLGLIVYTFISVIGGVALFPEAQFPVQPILAGLIAFPPLMLLARIMYMVWDQYGWGDECP